MFIFSSFLKNLNVIYPQKIQYFYKTGSKYFSFTILFHGSKIIKSAVKLLLNTEYFKSLNY
jgi:hypothetical protein